MSKILFQLVTGPENTTRAALALLVAKTAAADGHDVTLFLAGDAVQFLRDETLDEAHGVGTGSLREHYTALADAGVAIYGSGMSSRARGIDASAIGSKSVELVQPSRLVELIANADQVVTY